MFIDSYVIKEIKKFTFYHYNNRLIGKRNLRMMSVKKD